MKAWELTLMWGRHLVRGQIGCNFTVSTNFLNNIIELVYFIQTNSCTLFKTYSHQARNT